MRHIYKYQLPSGTGRFVLSMPPGSKTLSVQHQNGILTLWAEVPWETPSRFVSFPFYVFCTGDELPDVPMNYLATVQNNGIVLHVYESK